MFVQQLAHRVWLSGWCSGLAWLGAQPLAWSPPTGGHTEPSFCPEPTPAKTLTLPTGHCGGPRCSLCTSTLADSPLALVPMCAKLPSPATPKLLSAAAHCPPPPKVLLSSFQRKVSLRGVAFTLSMGSFVALMAVVRATAHAKLLSRCLESNCSGQLGLCSLPECSNNLQTEVL